MEEYKILNHKVKLLDLKTLGINQKEFLRFISSSFEKLFPDKYDVEREQTALLKTYYGNLYNSKYKNRFVKRIKSKIFRQKGYIGKRDIIGFDIDVLN